MKNKFTIVVFVIVPLIVYFPAFVTEFGMHNDYSLLPGNFHDRQMHDESSKLFMVGRALGAFLTNILSWSVNSVSDLAFVRLISFFLMLAISWLFAQFLRRRLGLNCYWSTLIALAMMILSSAQFFIMLSTNMIPGSVAVILAVLSYLLWDSAVREKEKNLFTPIKVVVAAFLFLAALFIYPPDALFVFVFTFAIIALSSPEKRSPTLKTVIQDVLFFGLTMGVYLAANLSLLIPNAKLFLNFIDKPTGIYHFSFTQNIFGKLTLMMETFLAALSGIWHPVLGNPGAIINAAIIAGSCLGIFYAYRGKAKKETFIYIGQIILLGTFLFFLINITPLLAKDCFHFVGYRILFPSAVMMLVWQFGFLQKFADGLTHEKNIFFLKFLAAAIILCGSGLAAANVYSASRNLHAELIFIRQKVGEIDFTKKNSVMAIMIRDPKIPLANIPPYEWDYYQYTPTRLAFIIKDLARQRGYTNVTTLLDSGEIIFFDQWTALIDFHELFAKSQKTWPSRSQKPFVYVTTSAGPDKQIKASQVTNSFLRFEEIDPDSLMLKNVFWVVDFNKYNSPWFQLDFMKPTLLRGIALGTLGPNLYLQPIDYRIQGSVDGGKWKDLDTQARLDNWNNPTNTPTSVIYLRKDFIPYSKYRFYYKKTLSETVEIAGVQVQVGL